MIRRALRNPIRNYLRLFLLAFGLFALTSCSSIQLAYSQLDRWMRWQLDDYVDLSGEQKQQLAIALESFHSWHRQTQLPRYAEFLEQLATKVEAGQIEELRLQSIEEQTYEFADTAGKQLYAYLMPLVAGLSPEQVTELEQNLREKRRESLEKWQKSPEKIQRKRNRRIRHESERWLGSLSDEQEALITAWVAEVEYNPLYRDHQRQLWQARFIELLRTKPEGYQAQIRDLMTNPQQLWSEEYRQMQERRHSQARALSEKILASTTPQQRRHLTDTLRDYAEDFRILASR